MSIMLAGLFLLVFALIMAIAVFGFLYRQKHRQKVVKDMLQTVAGKSSGTGDQAAEGH